MSRLWLSPPPFWLSPSRRRLTLQQSNEVFCSCTVQKSQKTTELVPNRFSSAENPGCRLPDIHKLLVPSMKTRHPDPPGLSRREPQKGAELGFKGLSDGVQCLFVLRIPLHLLPHTKVDSLPVVLHTGRLVSKRKQMVKDGVPIIFVSLVLSTDNRWRSGKDEGFCKGLHYWPPAPPLITCSNLLDASPFC